jgi:putative phosphoribosyl transferase
MFDNLAGAGRALADQVVTELGPSPDVIVLAVIPNGAPVAIPVAEALGVRAQALPVTRTDEGLEFGELPDVAGRVVVVIDDGVETGRVAREVARVLRHKGEPLAAPSRLILAVPVCSREAMAGLNNLYDQIIAVDQPMGRRALSWHFTDFDTIEEAAALRLLAAQVHAR